MAGAILLCHRFRIELGMKLGSGSFGEVYTGREVSSNEKIAAKKCHINRDVDGRSAVKEVMCLSKLNHRNILQLIDCDFLHNEVWMVLEFCNGGNLDKYFRDCESLPSLELKINIMAQCTNAVKFMHRRDPQIVHRDLKPANILLVKQAAAFPLVKIADFGLAKVLGTTTHEFYTNVGTAFFKAPEFFNAPDWGLSFDFKVDVFSLGLVFVAMLQYTAESTHLAPPRGSAGIPIGQYMVSCRQEGKAIPMLVRENPAVDSRVMIITKQLCKRMLVLEPDCRASMDESEATISEITHLIHKSTLHVTAQPMKIDGNNRGVPNGYTSKYFTSRDEWPPAGTQQNGMVLPPSGYDGQSQYMTCSVSLPAYRTGNDRQLSSTTVQKRRTLEMSSRESSGVAPLSAAKSGVPANSSKSGVPANSAKSGVPANSANSGNGQRLGSTTQQKMRREVYSRGSSTASASAVKLDPFFPRTDTESRTGTASGYQSTFYPSTCGDSSKLPRPFNPSVTPYTASRFHTHVLDACDQKRIGIKECKLAVVGNLGVGKSSLVFRLHSGEFRDVYVSTISIDYFSKNVSILEVPYKLLLWDTAGQEQFRAMNRSYYRNIDVVLAVFDLTKQTSLAEIDSWVNDVSVSSPDALVFLVGTKKDLIGESTYRKTEAMAIKKAKVLKAEFWAVSAKTGENVDALFSRVVALAFNEAVLADLTNHESAQGTVIKCGESNRYPSDQSNEGRNRGSCC